MKYAIVLCIALVSVLAMASDLSSPEGLWLAPDPSGGPEGLIRVYQDHGAYFARIEPTSPDKDKSKRCTRCSDERKDQLYNGLVIIRNMRPEGDEYTGGDVLDPQTGKVYGCTFKLTDGGHKMIMRGFLGLSLLGRSQTWQRVDSSSQ